MRVFKVPYYWDNNYYTMLSSREESGEVSVAQAFCELDRDKGH